MVDEEEYRSTYKAINERRCAFEKAVLSGRCTCLYAMRFFLADREGVQCESRRQLERCTRLLDLLRTKARFALKLTSTAGALPHTKDIQVQIGGLTGLTMALKKQQPIPGSPCEIAALVEQGQATYGALENFPFQEIMKSIVSYAGRRRRPGRIRH